MNPAGHRLHVPDPHGVERPPQQRQRPLEGVGRVLPRETSELTRPSGTEQHGRHTRGNHPLRPRGSHSVGFVLVQHQEPHPVRHRPFANRPPATGADPHQRRFVGLQNLVAVPQCLPDQRGRDFIGPVAKHPLEQFLLEPGGPRVVRLFIRRQWSGGPGDEALVNAVVQPVGGKIGVGGKGPQVGPGDRLDRRFLHRAVVSLQMPVDEPIRHQPQFQVVFMPAGSHSNVKQLTRLLREVRVVRLQPAADPLVRRHREDGVVPRVLEEHRPRGDQRRDGGPFPAVVVVEEHAVAVTVDHRVGDVALQVGHPADGDADFHPRVGRGDPQG